MKIKMGYSMWYSGTDSEWTEEIPDHVVAEGDEAVAEYLEETRDYLFLQACEKISVWAETIE